MNSEERKQKLKELISSKEPCRTGIPITYHGKTITLDAYDIPLEYLVYNPYNGRIGSVVKSYERQNAPIDPESPEGKGLIEKFLWDSKPEANKKTRYRLLKEQQQKHGIVTSDGVIIDGNRRACLLNNIREDKSIPFTDKMHCQYFIAIILPDDADKKEVLALETTYQMGEDAKVDYNPIEKYLKSKDLFEMGFTKEDIAEMMGVKVSFVETMLSALNLMDDYLDTYDYTGMYTQLDKNEDSFLKLDTALKKYKSGVPSMWDYNPETDVSDLKLIAFDHIRAKFEQTLFRDIITAPTAKKNATSFFSKKDVWTKFRDQHFACVDNVEEESVEKIASTNPPDLGVALKARDKIWQNKIEESFNRNYAQSKDRLSNYANSAQPLQQLIKACEALEVVDVEQSSFRTDNQVRQRIKDLDVFVQHFKKILKM